MRFSSLTALVTGADIRESCEAEGEAGLEPGRSPNEGQMQHEDLRLKRLNAGRLIRPGRTFSGDSSRGIAGHENGHSSFDVLTRHAKSRDVRYSPRSIPGLRIPGRIIPEYLAG